MPLFWSPRSHKSRLRTQQTAATMQPIGCSQVAVQESPQEPVGAATGGAIEIPCALSERVTYRCHFFLVTVPWHFLVIVTKDTPAEPDRSCHGDVGIS